MVYKGYRVGAVKAPTHNQMSAAGLSKVKHPEAPLEAAALEESLQAQRSELAEMARLLEEDPEMYDRYFDQVAETGEIKTGGSTTVTVEQVPAKKRTARKVGPPRRKSVKARAKPKAIEASPPAPGQGATVIPVPPPVPGSMTIRQED